MGDFVFGSPLRPGREDPRYQQRRKSQLLNFLAVRTRVTHRLLLFAYARIREQTEEARAQRLARKRGGAKFRTDERIAVAKNLGGRVLMRLAVRKFVQRLARIFRL